VTVGKRGEVAMGFARHYDVRAALYGGDRELVRRGDGGLRGGERPGAEAGVC
jgi:hypothetical protein